MTVQQFKKNNKVARERIAIKLGYPNAAAYITFLGGAIAVDPYKQAGKSTGRARIIRRSRKAPVELKTVHNVHILDASGSMRGARIASALQGINTETEALKADKTVIYTNTLVSFSYYNDIKTHTYMTPIQDATSVYMGTRGSTALHDAVGITLTRLRASKKYDEKVLVKIFTDGGENNSQKWRAEGIKALIAELELEGFTVVFVGMEDDVQYAIKSYGVHASNTMSHDGSMQSVNTAFMASNASTMRYSNKLSRGLDVKKGFFKTKGKL